MSNICIIPARGGSKRIPRKNVKPFLGKPVMAYSIEAALQSGLFDEVMVSTDDVDFANIARQYGAKVPFMRLEKTSNDFASTVDVLLEVLAMYREQNEYFENVCCLYSTAPFVTAERLKEAYLNIEGGADASFTMVQYSYPVQRSLRVNDKGFVEMIYPEYLSSRSQDLEPIYHDAGQFYFAKVSALEEQKTLWCKKTVPLVLSELEVQDLDTLTDWQLAEMKYSLIHK